MCIRDRQWGQTPEEIDPNTTARVPVFLSEDCRYFQDAYQGMPLEGYTPMFQSLLDHPDITVELGVDAASRLTLDGSAALLDGRPFSGPIIYTGAADELFGCKYGRLPYRTLDFRFETHPVDFWQSHGTVDVYKRQVLGCRMWGYKKVNCKLEIDEKTAPMVRRIFELYATNPVSYTHLSSSRKCWDTCACFSGWSKYNSRIL